MKMSTDDNKPKKIIVSQPQEAVDAACKIALQNIATDTLSSISADLQTGEPCADAQKSIADIQYAILETMVDLAGRRDSATRHHVEKIEKYINILITAMKQESVYRQEIRDWDIEKLVKASRFHDIGKLGIRDEVLLRPGKFTNAEYDEMKLHAGLGGHVIEFVCSCKESRGNELLQHAKVMATSHHERWDGLGYPLGLTGENIPLQGRLIAVVDIYDALTSERPYKAALTYEDAIGIIRSELGRQIDPMIGGVFIKHSHLFDSKGGV